MHAIFSLFQLKVDFLISITVYVETCIHFSVNMDKEISEELERHVSNITTL